jgi:hypothetical protein
MYVLLSWDESKDRIQESGFRIQEPEAQWKESQL